MDLNALLLRHFQKYPLMRPQDAVKLLYQNEFGAAHAAGGDGGLALLREEIRCTAQYPASSPVEAIGNGYCRVQLGTLGLDSGEPEAL